MTEIVRRALRRYRQEAEGRPGKDTQRLLKRTRGLWRAGDALVP